MQAASQQIRRSATAQRRQRSRERVRPARARSATSGKQRSVRSQRGMRSLLRNWYELHTRIIGRNNGVSQNDSVGDGIINLLLCSNIPGHYHSPVRTQCWQHRSGSDDCNGSTPATITGTSETSTGTISYKWEAAVSPFSTWNEISGAISKDFAPATLTATTEYRRTTVSVMGSSTCYSVPTSPVTITVQSELNAGSIAADQTICNGATPATITGTFKPARARSVTSGKQRSVRSQRGMRSLLQLVRTTHQDHWP